MNHLLIRRLNLKYRKIDHVAQTTNISSATNASRVLNNTTNTPQQLISTFKSSPYHLTRLTPPIIMPPIYHTISTKFTFPPKNNLPSSSNLRTVKIPMFSSSMMVLVRKIMVLGSSSGWRWRFRLVVLGWGGFSGSIERCGWWMIEREGCGASGEEMMGLGGDGVVFELLFADEWWDLWIRVRNRWDAVTEAPDLMEGDDCLLVCYCRSIFTKLVLRMVRATITI